MTAASDETARIERDLEETRARLDATLEALQQKLSPGQMVDQTMNWFKEGDGAEFGRNLGRAVRDNPIPVALIGVGLGWLMINSVRHPDDESWDEDDYLERGYRGRSYRTRSAVPHQPQPYAAAAYDDLATKAHDAGARLQRGPDESEESFKERVYSAKGSVVGVSRQAGEALSGFVERVERAIEAAADKFRQMTHEASAAASRAADRIGDAADHTLSRSRAGLRSLYGYGQSAAYGARGHAGHTADRARDVSLRTAGYVKEQPLLMGVIGLTVGAVLGMLVPPTRYEREIADDLRRTLGDQARGVASDLTQRAAHVAEAVLDTAHEAAQREGLVGMSPGSVAAGAREQIAGTARSVRKVVEESVQAGEEALKDEAKDVASSPSSSTNRDAVASAGSGEHGDRRPVA